VDVVQGVEARFPRCFLLFFFGSVFLFESQVDGCCWYGTLNDNVVVAHGGGNGPAYLCTREMMWFEKRSGVSSFFFVFLFRVFLVIVMLSGVVLPWLSGSSVLVHSVVDGPFYCSRVYTKSLLYFCSLH
jgi:hypothetical protein